MYFLPACLLLSGLFAIALRNWQMLGAASILLLNWRVNTTVVEWSQQAYPWSWFLCTDYISGLVVLLVALKPSLWQAIITALFALECIAHGSFGLTKETAWTVYYYWWTLHYVAWSQFWIVTFWGLCELAGRARRVPSFSKGLECDQPAPPKS